MDVELFLEGQERWEADSPHHLMVLHEMFQHASEQVQKEAEGMVCWGCGHGLPKMDPEADVSAVQLVVPQTSMKEIKSLYYKVYKLWRLLGVSSQRARTCRRGGGLLRRLPGVGKGWNASDGQEAQPNWSSAPKEQDPKEDRRDATAGRSLTEGEGGPLEGSDHGGCLRRGDRTAEPPPIRSWSKAWAHSQSRDHHRCRSWRQKRMHCQLWPEDCLAPSFEYHPSWRGSESKGGTGATEDLNLEDPLELGPEVTCFLQGPAEGSEEEDVKAPSPSLQ